MPSKLFLHLNLRMTLIQTMRRHFLILYYSLRILPLILLKCHLGLLKRLKANTKHISSNLLPLIKVPLLKHPWYLTNFCSNIKKMSLKKRPLNLNLLQKNFRMIISIINSTISFKIIRFRAPKSINLR